MMNESQKEFNEFTDTILMLGIEAMLLPQVEKNLNDLNSENTLSEARKKQLAGWLDKRKNILLKRGELKQVIYKEIEITVFESHENENLSNYYLAHNHYAFKVNKWVLKSECHEKEKKEKI